jgi:hypothetical protein
MSVAPTVGATIYSAGTSPLANDPNVGVATFGAHLLDTDALHPSVAGVGGSGISAAGTPLDQGRTYIYDHGAATDLADGIANRGDAGFAMLIWDMGAAYDSVRLYTDQDHYSGGPISDPFVAQDVMEYSVWGSTDGDHFSLLSDVTAFNINGGGAGLPTYTFFGTAPSIVYRGGSGEFGIHNAYTREYVFPNAYQFYGIRASSISVAANDADPELDALAAFNISDRPPGTPGTQPPDAVPEPAALGLFTTALAALGWSRRKARRG